MDDFSVFGSSFDHCLNNLDKMLQRCKDAHLVLNWEKCHFMVKEGIVLGHKVSEAGLEVDKAKNQFENDETSDDSEVDNNFPGETLMEISTEEDPWFAEFENYLVSDIIPKLTSNTTSGRNPTSSKYVLTLTKHLPKQHRIDVFQKL
ncbi:hypothetical protein Tco_0474563 [Tanacetum coccineum]